MCAKKSLGIYFLAVYFTLPALHAQPAGKCVHLRTKCPGKGWVTSHCEETNPCGFSSDSASPSSGPSATDEAARALGTALGQSLACKMFGMGCPGSVDNAGARASYYNMSAEQKSLLLKAMAEQEAEGLARQNKVNDVLKSGAMDGLELRALDETPLAPAKKKQINGALKKQIHVLDCVMAESFLALKGQGSEGRDLAQELQLQLNDLKKNMPKFAADGTAGDHKTLSMTYDSMKEKRTQAGSQFVLSATYVRNEETGSVNIYVNYSLGKGGQELKAGQEVVQLDAKGDVLASEVSTPAVERCLKS